MRFDMMESTIASEETHAFMEANTDNEDLPGAGQNTPKWILD